jgi:predicted ATPase
MRLSIENFKCFSLVEIAFAPLTVLTGYNGSGKSTVTQPLLALSQSFRRNPTAAYVDVDGSLINLGSLSTLVRSGGGSEVSFSISEGEDRGEWRLGPQRSEIPGHVTTTPSGQSFAGSKLFRKLKDLSYLSVQRTLGPAFKGPATGRAIGDVGIAGEYAAYWHFYLGDTDVPENRRHPQDERVNVRGQLNAYFNELFPAAEAASDKLQSVDLWRLDFHIGRASWVSPTNIGFGLTYVFPILMSLLTMPAGGLVVIDSPEAHLHPRAQSRLGWIVGRLAASGISVIVETHSDHFLNGVRLAVKAGQIPSDQVKLLFFSGASDNEHGIEELRVDGEGNISNWPSGFFDQAEHDMVRLLGLEN